MVTQPGYRYGAVFALTLVLLVFVTVAPNADWAHATAVALEAAALVVVVATSRGRAAARRERALVVGSVATLIVVLIAAGVVPEWLTFAIAGLLAAAIPAALVTGLLRLVRGEGVTLQAVAGALGIYLLVGLLFAWTIAFASAVGDGPYFSQGGVESGERVYYSFTVLTTTGFGDLTPETPIGRALAVVEMLVGQLYLVTVIGVMVGHLVGGRRS